MKCEEVRDEMIAYLKGELDEERKKEVDEHLARCQGCSRELELSQRVLFQTQAANEPSVVDMAEDIIKKAIESGASDIHVDPTREGAEVRFRIDGVLYPIRQLSVQERDALIARIKLTGGMSIVENRLPQDGRLSTKVNDVEYDLRVSVTPLVFGEKMVMRILSKATPLLGLDKLGFLPEQIEMVRNLVHHPPGMVVVTGPTGAGKTTTLYSMLLEIRGPGISIMTIEDPVELLLDGVQQAQVNAKAGLTFAVALRSFLRQDPDVIMTGEIRDLETGQVALAAAVTGHLVLTAIHPADAPSAVVRMVDVGLEPFLVGQSLIGAIAQRLVRKVCPDCCEEYTPSDESLDFLGLKNQVGKSKFYRGKGCENCRGTGVRGRTAIFEVMEIDRELGRMIAEKKDADAICKRAVEKGFITMAEVARKKVLEGITTAEEAYRVLSCR